MENAYATAVPVTDWRSVPFASEAVSLSAADVPSGATALSFTNVTLDVAHVVPRTALCKAMFVRAPSINAPLDSMRSTPSAAILMKPLSMDVYVAVPDLVKVMAPVPLSNLRGDEGLSNGDQKVSPR